MSATLHSDWVKKDVTGLKVACIGAGYVGGPTMAVLACQVPSITVTVCDVNAARINEWNSDKLPIYEPGLDEQVKTARGRNLFFSDDVEGTVAAADVIFISVNTPTKRVGIGAGAAADVKNLELCARTIAKVCTSSKIIVEKSTVPVKTAETLNAVFAANSAPGVEFAVLSNPEFLAEGTAIRDLLEPSRVLLGGANSPAGAQAIATVASLYAQWVPRERILTTNLWSSELSKLVANAFLAQRVSSINSISALCEATGADVTEVARAVGSDYRVGPHFLKASVGFGGSCFQKDVLNLVYLCRTYGLTEVADYWAQVIQMNDWQKLRFAHLIVSTLFSTVAGKRIAMFGFAFKKDTGDTRETAAAYVAKTLLQEGAHVVVYDPKVTRAGALMELEYTHGMTEANMPSLKTNLTFVDDPKKAVDGAHAIAVMTEWDEFKTYDYTALHERMSKPAFVFDGRGILDKDALTLIGFETYCIGQAKQAAVGGPLSPGFMSPFPSM